jgi:hypothetical protein
MALKVNAMKLKMNAIGEKNILETERWFLEVVLLDGTSKSVFVGAQWAFGKARDSIEHVLKVDLLHEKAKLRDATKTDLEIASDRLVKEAIPNGGTLQFISL